MNSINAKSFYHSVLKSAVKLFGAEKVRLFEARLRYGRNIDLNNPTTLADKVSWLEFRTDQTKQSLLTDKIEVREYVKSKGLHETLIPIVAGPWTVDSEFDIPNCEKGFVLKATHGCGMNHVEIPAKGTLQTVLKSKVNRWLSQEYGKACIEPHYKSIEPRVYAEAYISSSSETLVDYKIHMLNGKPAFILVCSERESGAGLSLSLYDPSWKQISGLKPGKKRNLPMPRPNNLASLLEVAGILAAEFDFVRVDLYSIEERVLFGEMTFSPAGGILPNFTDDFLSDFGKKLQLKDYQ